VIRTTIEILGETLKLVVLAGLAIAGILVIQIWKKGLATKVTYLRFVVQAVTFVAVFYMFTFSVWQLIILAVILIMPIIFGRLFCGWLCPFGLYMDAITLIRKAARIRHRDLSEKLNKALHNLRYFLLLFFLIAPVILVYSSPPQPFEVNTRLALVLAGPFTPLRILTGPLIPLIVPWIGPLEIGGIYFSYPYVQEAIVYATSFQELILFVNEFFVEIMALVFLSLTIVGSFFIRRGWCRFCPTGSSIAVLNRFRGFKWTPIFHLEKEEQKCTKCGICKRVCPVQVTQVYEQKGGKITTSMCMSCLRCVEMCPEDSCLKFKAGSKTLFKSRNWLEPTKSE
jgi:ferredoxin-type protein NapH